MAIMRGTTLIELLIALALGAMLSAAMVAAYADSRRHQFYGQEIARLKENGRHAMRLLSGDIAMAGFSGGIPGAALPPAATIAVDCADEPWALDLQNPLDVVNDWDGSAGPVTVGGQTLSCLDPAYPLAGSDVLVLRRVGAAPAQFLGAVAATLTSSSVLGWYLQVEDGSPQSWEQLAPRDIAAGRNSNPGVSLWPAVARIYSVQRDQGGVPQLCAETLAGNRMVSRCMVEGVEQLQFEYGIDRNGDGAPEQFVSSPGPDDLALVVAARVHLLLRSVRPLSGHRDRHPHDLGDRRIPAANDRFLRVVMSRTVVIDRVVRRIGGAV